MKNFTVKEKIKLSRFLLDAYKGGLSFSVFNKLLRKKDIKINGVRTSKDIMLNVDDVVSVYYDGEQRKLSYETVYSDENVLVVVKPKGITSEDFYALLNEERKKLCDSHTFNIENVNNDNELFFCHRLDRNTDGLMIFAKTEKAYEEILDGFKLRTFIKVYTAEVYGKFDNKEGVLTAYLFKDEKNSLVKIYDNKVKGSLPIKTGYKVVEEGENTSIIEVELFTGRTHQIRAHMAYIGHFVLGDGKYGVEKINNVLGVKKLRLSSTKLTLRFDSEKLLCYLDGKTFTCKQNWL